MRVRFTFAVLLTFALALPATAGAVTKVVTMGAPKSAEKSFLKAESEANAFFPASVTIAAGDSVRFVPGSFHSVELPAKGKKPKPLITPGQPVAGAVDAAGAPFWFNTQPALGFNPALLASGFGKRFAYTGAKAVSSGLPLADNPRPMTVRFPRAGTYTYYCNVHPGMDGTVRVRAAGASAPASAADAQRVKTQVSEALRVARSLANTTPPAGVMDLGASGRGGVERFAMFPSALTVPVGTTLKFQMTPASREVHTATTGPGDPDAQKAPGSYLAEIEKAFNSPAGSQLVFYPSDQPGAPANLTPTLHGNGFWNSGTLDASSAVPGPPANSVRFAAAGTYQFFCMIHIQMRATITVQ